MAAIEASRCSEESSMKARLEASRALARQLWVASTCEEGEGSWQAWVQGLMADLCQAA